jgi:hypothetical protein
LRIPKLRLKLIMMRGRFMDSVQSESQETELIGVAAFFLWEQRGRPLGTPEVDWFRAEATLRMHREQSSGKPGLVTVAETVGSALGKVAALAASVGS